MSRKTEPYTTQTYTQSNRARYPLPPSVETVLSVSYFEFGQDLGVPLFFLEPDESDQLKHVTELNGVQSADEALEFLKRTHDKYRLECWTVYEGELLIWPPAINDGDVLYLEIIRHADQSEVGAEAPQA